MYVSLVTGNSVLQFCIYLFFRNSYFFSFFALFLFLLLLPSFLLPSIHPFSNSYKNPIKFNVKFSVVCHSYRSFFLFVVLLSCGFRVWRIQKVLQLASAVVSVFQSVLYVGCVVMLTHVHFNSFFSIRFFYFVDLRKFLNLEN